MDVLLCLSCFGKGRRLCDTVKVDSYCSRCLNFVQLREASAEREKSLVVLRSFRFQQCSAGEEEVKRLLFEEVERERTLL